jgi:hypothetical protein
LVGAALAACGGAGADEPIPVEPDGGIGTSPQDPAVAEAQRVLAEQLGVNADEIEHVMTEQVEWADACLELGEADEMCAQVITSGWRVTFNVNGEEYEVRTDETGGNVRIANVAG